MEAPRDLELEAAIDIAHQAHAGQVDKSGEPYIDHPRRVAQNVESYFMTLDNCSREAVIAAWLHDVIEDSGYFGPQITEGDLRAKGISNKVVEIVKLLTFTKSAENSDDSETRKATVKFSDKLAYYNTIKTHPLARVVKICDLADNCNLQRVEAMKKSSGMSVNPDKYPLALAALELTDEEWHWFNFRIGGKP